MNVNYPQTLELLAGTRTILVPAYKKKITVYTGIDSYQLPMRNAELNVSVTYVVETVKLTVSYHSFLSSMAWPDADAFIYLLHAVVSYVWRNKEFTKSVLQATVNFYNCF